MVYKCENPKCGFLFGRESEVSVCPKCGRPNVIPATPEEVQAFRQMIEKQE